MIGLPNPYLIVATFLAFSVAVGGAYLKGRSDGADKGLAAQVVALNRAMLDEQARYQELNKTLQDQADETANINAGLADDLERMRHRAARLSEAARADCKGATGAELSGFDAGFLVREAARADTIRAALIACYRYADTVAGKTTR